VQPDPTQVSCFRGLPLSRLLASPGDHNSFRLVSSFSVLLLCLSITGHGVLAQNKSEGAVFQPNTTLTEREAAENLRHSAEAGSAKAQSELSKAYMGGTVLQRNVPEAVRWVRAAAYQGLAEAEVDLAILYLEGTGVPQDYSKGFLWMKKAADQGDPKAEYNVGALYGLGRGVAKDVPEGIRWYLKAAEAGHQRAAYNMGLAYEQGVGVPHDLVKAYMWHYLAANRLGYSPSQEILRELGAKIGPAKVEEGRQQASVWIKAHPNVKPVPM
jgi:TPR repeat protein